MLKLTKFVKIFNIFTIANENRNLYIHIYNLSFFIFIQKMLRFLTHLSESDPFLC